ncbi:hypothetical protein DFH07DRAFT_1008759 [Mycena maculata]|uniref:Uncharacterized protein n=1 Tax=Mycena maculata TaxID=230809 RepID=A0AAD7JQK7_9AGAR|nr:hypothetical protein DFH07DRAFT_1008759 [Mycena maculata]
MCHGSNAVAVKIARINLVIVLDEATRGAHILLGESMRLGIVEEPVEAVKRGEAEDACAGEKQTGAGRVQFFLEAEQEFQRFGSSPDQLMEFAHRITSLPHPTTTPRGVAAMANPSRKLVFAWVSNAAPRPRAGPADPDRVVVHQRIRMRIVLGEKVPEPVPALWVDIRQSLEGHGFTVTFFRWIGGKSGCGGIGVAAGDTWVTIFRQIRVPVGHLTHKMKNFSSDLYPGQRKVVLLNTVLSILSSGTQHDGLAQGQISREGTYESREISGVESPAVKHSTLLNLIRDEERVGKWEPGFGRVERCENAARIGRGRGYEYTAKSRRPETLQMQRHGIISISAVGSTYSRAEWENQSAERSAKEEGNRVYGNGVHVRQGFGMGVLVVTRARSAGVEEQGLARDPKVVQRSGDGVEIGVHTDRGRRKEVRRWEGWLEQTKAVGQARVGRQATGGSGRRGLSDREGRRGVAWAWTKRGRRRHGYDVSEPRGLYDNMRKQRVASSRRWHQGATLKAEAFGTEGRERKWLGVAEWSRKGAPNEWEVLQDSPESDVSKNPGCTTKKGPSVQDIWRIFDFCTIPRCKICGGSNSSVLDLGIGQGVLINTRNDYRPLSAVKSDGNKVFGMKNHWGPWFDQPPPTVFPAVWIFFSTLVNEQPNALHKVGGYVRVFVVFGHFYTEIRPVYSEGMGMWLPEGFQPWLHIFEAKVGGRRPLFHALAEEVARHWYTCE